MRLLVCLNQRTKWPLTRQGYYNYIIIFYFSNTIVQDMSNILVCKFSSSSYCKWQDLQRLETGVVVHGSQHLTTLEKDQFSPVAKGICQCGICDGKECIPTEWCHLKFYSPLVDVWLLLQYCHQEQSSKEWFNVAVENLLTMAHQAQAPLLGCWGPVPGSVLWPLPGWGYTILDCSFLRRKATWC